MRLRLWQRLFIAFATLSVLALAGLAAWQQQAFRRGFLGYLDEVALHRLQPASVRLANAYAEHGNWEFLRDHPERFGELIDDRREAVPPDAFDRPPPPHDNPPQPSEQMPPPPDVGGDPSEPPPGDDRPPPGEQMPPADAGREPRDAPPDGRRPPPYGPPDLRMRLVLVDSQGSRVVGNANVPPDAPTVDIDYRGNRVGALRLAPMPRLSDAVDVAFAHAQLRNALIAAVAVLAGALVLAFALARWLLKPVHALAHGTRALAAGDYSSRLAIQRNDELGLLADDFNHLAATLEQHRDARRRWGADIAHELRTPLSVLRGEIDALQDGVREPTPAALDSLQAECTRLGTLIEDLYQLSLADAGALEYRFERIDIGELVRDALDLQRRVCADTGLALDEAIASGVQIRGDARRLTQLIDNLLANARRYTDAPGRIRVEVTSTDEGARLVVEDTPPGVPTNALPRLFERLFRVEASRSRAAGGAGLGLAICRAIVDAHAGRIEATQSPLGGLRITVELPGDRA